MSTDTIFTGRESRLLVKDEASYGVAPSGNWLATYFYSSGLAAARPFEDDPVIGVGGATARDPFDPAPGLTAHGGALVVPLDLAHIGYWLKLAFGAPTTTGTTDKTHVFTSGAVQLPTYAAEIKAASGEFRQHLGLAARSIRFAMAKEAGFRRVDLDLVGKGEAKLGASGGGAPAAALDRVPLPGVVGVVRWNGTVVGKALAADLTYATGMDGERYLDGATNPDEISGIVPAADPSLTGSIRVRAPVSTLDDAAIAGTPDDLEIEYALSATRSLLIAAPRVFLERSGRPIDGPGGLEQTLNLRAAQTAAAAMATVTLKNAVTSY